MKYTSKKQLLTSIDQEHAAFLELAATIPQRRYAEEGVWGNDWTIKDLFIHLREWEELLLGWYEQGKRDGTVELPAPGYKWHETPRLNQDIQSRTCRRSWRSAKAQFDATHAQIVQLVRSLPEKKLFEPGHYSWTKKNALVAYVGANTSSHYRTAAKILKRWKKQQAGEPL